MRRHGWHAPRFGPGRGGVRHNPMSKQAAQPVRLQRSRAKGSRLVSPNGLPVVCVTRGTRWGNPFRREKHGAKWAVSMFRLLMRRKLAEIARRLQAVGVKEEGAILSMIYLQCGPGHWMQTHLADLRGKNLACWCKPGEPCHADILLKLANAEL